MDPVSFLAAVCLAQGGVFDEVVERVRSSLQALEIDAARFDERAQWYQPMVAAAASAREEHAVINQLLAELKLSHLALLEGKTYEYLRGELNGDREPTLGLQVTRLRDRYYASSLLEGGPAERHGIQLGDRIVSIDGKAPEHSGRLLPAGGDPGLESAPAFLLAARASESVTIAVQSEPEATSRRLVVLETRTSSGLQVARQSARLIAVAGKRVGYLHLGYMAPLALPEVVRELLAGKLAAADGLLLDLRGRGGFEQVANQILSLFVARRDGTPALWQKPLVVLIDRQSRSAKEVLAYYLHRYGFPLVGERTAGAVLAAGFHSLSDGSVLMHPLRRVPVRGGIELEGRGVRPDHEVDQPLEFARGVDHIKERGIAVLLARLQDRAARRLVAGGGSVPELDLHHGAWAFRHGDRALLERPRREDRLARGAGPEHAQLIGARRDVAERKPVGSLAGR